MVRSDMRVVPAVTSKTKLPRPPSIRSVFGEPGTGPVMVTLCPMASFPLLNRIVAGAARLKAIVSPAPVPLVQSPALVSAAVLGAKTVEQLEQLVRETGGGPRYLPDDDLRQIPRALDRVGIQS